MTEERRKVYDDLAKEDEERYQREVLLYKDVLENFKHQDEISRQFMEALRSVAPSNIEDGSNPQTSIASESQSVNESRDEENPLEYIGT